MIGRRGFLALGGAAVVSPLAACGPIVPESYQGAAARARAPLLEKPGFTALVRFATLAPSGHNTQPWTFVDHGAGLAILPDVSRRTPVVDPDDHHLFVSLGCAAETLLIAAAAGGRPGAIAFDPAGEGRIAIDLGQGQPRPEGLFRAIPARQSTRSVYDGRAVPVADLARLEQAAAIEGVSLRFLTEPAQRRAVLDLVVHANTLQMADPAFIRELRTWIRFNPEQAMKTADGLFSGCSGNPALPSWLGERAFGLVFTPQGENDRYRKQIHSSAGVAVFTGEREDKDHWVRVGRSFQRFALMATAMGVRCALINQPVESPVARAQFAAWLGAPSLRPDLCVRFGYAPPMPMSLRRPAAEAISAA